MDKELDLPIVAIGASAGGVQALQTFFDQMADDTDAAFVVIVHLDPEHRSELAGILAVHTAMQVMQVDEEAPPQGKPCLRHFTKPAPQNRRRADCRAAV